MVLLLVIIYVSFISLGLPDSLLGSAWPSMYESLGVSMSNAGIISMIIAGGTIISSLLSDRVIKKFGTGPVTFVSVLMTAVALMGFSFSNAFVLLCLWAIPLGLGAGAVDAALNNFVALHYEARHMNWLHCFWGVGASAGPVIMSYYLVQRGSWNAGYRIISFMQFALVLVLLMALPLWKKARGASDNREKSAPKALGIVQLTRLPGAKPILVAFFCYCSLETSVGLWGSSYLVAIRNITAETAARWISLYFLGITLGRFLSGFLAIKLAHKQMVRLGQLLIGFGVVLLLLPFSGLPLIAGLFLIGLGCAPIYPSLLHETPDNFGSEYSQSIMGMQMACAYAGTTFMPPLFGILAARISYGIFPLYLSALLVLMVFMVKLLYNKAGRIRDNPDEQL